MAPVGAHFTPSLLDSDTLERLFVARHHLLDDAVGRIERAASSEERAAKLFVGPRGAGKTHLLSLVYYRARALPGFGERFQLAWLPEDMWTISSLDDLAAEIVAALEPAADLTGTEPVAAIIDAARRRGPIVALVENLDAVLDAIGSEGQRALRAVLENHRPMLLIATATRLGDDLLSQSEPFYGFFDTTALEPFDVDDAASMLKRIAEVNGDDRLAGRLDEQRSRNRLATVAHLAGGQPRVWALLGSGLTIEGLDDLVSTLMERFDDLTPYYQQQLERLSLHERKAVRALAAAEGALTVGQLAERTGIEAKSLAKTITELRRRGWVVRRTGLLADLGDKRRSYYQLAEPLARLAFQLKEARGRPVGLVVEFLKAWFDHDSLSADDHGGGVVDLYRAAACEAMLTDVSSAVAKAIAEFGHLDPSGWLTSLATATFHPDPRAPVNVEAGSILLELDDAIAAFEGGDPEPLLQRPPEISHLIERQLTDVGSGRVRLELAGLGLDRGGADRWIPRLEALSARLSGAAHAEATSLLAVHHLRRADQGPADVLLDEIAESASEETVGALVWLGERLLAEGEPERATTILEAASPSTPPEDRLRLARALGASYERAGQSQSAVSIWQNTTQTLEGALGPDHPDALASRHNLAFTHLRLGDTEKATPALLAVLADQERVLGSDHLDTLLTRMNTAAAHLRNHDPKQATRLIEVALASSETLLGGDHPNTLALRQYAAVLYGLTGDAKRAAVQLVASLADYERVLGPEDPGTIQCREELARAYQSGGDLDRAIPLWEATVADSERVLGPEHPETLARRRKLASAAGGEPVGIEGDAGSDTAPRAS
jgi:tetratricopeptide (TPR) repeat protein/DNA-binding MarR family transcriptional regulator